MKHSIPKDLIPLFNEFVKVTTRNSMLFKRIDVGVGETEDGIKGLSFDFETSLGLTTEQANSIFGEYIGLFPQCSISFNIRENSSRLEDALTLVVDSIIEVHEGFVLEEIK